VTSLRLKRAICYRYFIRQSSLLRWANWNRPPNAWLGVRPRSHDFRWTADGHLVNRYNQVVIAVEPLMDRPYPTWEVQSGYNTTIVMTNDHAQLRYAGYVISDPAMQIQLGSLIDHDHEAAKYTDTVWIEGWCIVEVPPSTS